LWCRILRSGMRILRELLSRILRGKNNSLRRTDVALVSKRPVTQNPVLFYDYYG
jgi:hypothetical protein